MLSDSNTATPRMAPRKKAMERDSESKESRSQSMAAGGSPVISNARLMVVDGSITTL